MARYDRFVEELLAFLLTRIDEDGLVRLVAHEPRRMSAPYFEGGGGRAETRGVWFTGCTACSRIPPGTLFLGHGHIDVPAWPCLHVRALALRFAGDPGYRAEWRPEFALFASGRLIDQEAER
ncbi:hypothetical protein ACWC5C_00890 [Streptomyces sp. NPDC001700]